MREQISEQFILIVLQVSFWDFKDNIENVDIDILKHMESLLPELAHYSFMAIKTGKAKFNRKIRGQLVRIFTIYHSSVSKYDKDSEIKKLENLKKYILKLFNNYYSKKVEYKTNRVYDLINDVADKGGKVPIEDLVNCIADKYQYSYTKKEMVEIIKQDFSEKFSIVNDSKDRIYIKPVRKVAFNSDFNSNNKANETNSQEHSLSINSVILLVNQIFHKCRCNHQVLPIKAKVYMLNTSVNILDYREINAVFCKNCNIYFCTHIDWELSFYGLEANIFPCYQPIDSPGVMFQNHRYKVTKPFALIMNKEHPVHMMGYNVSDENLSQHTRFCILKHYIEARVGSFVEIKAHLEYLINSRSRQNINGQSGSIYYRNAIEKWKTDLKKICDYASSQTGIKVVGKLKPYHR